MARRVHAHVQEAPIVGKWPLKKLGDHLATVAEHASFPCPACSRRGEVHVYTNGARWPCGHTRSLPPLPQQHPNSRRPKEPPCPDP